MRTIVAKFENPRTGKGAANQDVHAGPPHKFLKPGTRAFEQCARLTCVFTAGNESSVNFERLPIVDLGPLRTRDARALDALAQQIREACTTVGFFYVTNHGVPDVCVERVIESSRAFYRQPESEKQKVALAEHTHWRGWTGLGSEVTGGKRDWHECLDIMTEVEADASSPLRGHNRWPEQPADFRADVLSYFDAMKRVGSMLMEGLSLSCGMERSFFADRFGDPWCLLRILSYPQQPGEPAPDVGIGVGEHTDYGCLTLLTATEPGLFVRTPSGAWMEAPPIPGAFVCNLGDAMETWTYGVYKATPHRVVALRERLSIPFFFDPSLDAMIEPIDSFRAPHAPRTSSFRYGPYLLAAYERSYPSIARTR